MTSGSQAPSGPGIPLSIVFEIGSVRWAASRRSVQAMVLPVPLCASVTRPRFGPIIRSSEEDGAEKSAEPPYMADQSGEVPPNGHPGKEPPTQAKGGGGGTAGVTARKAVSMSSAQLYDTIGATYTVTRRTEPRIARRSGLRSAMRGPC